MFYAIVIFNLVWTSRIFD